MARAFISCVRRAGDARFIPQGDISAFQRPPGDGDSTAMRLSCLLMLITHALAFAADDPYAVALFQKHCATRHQAGGEAALLPTSTRCRHYGQVEVPQKTVAVGAITDSRPYRGSYSIPIEYTPAHLSQRDSRRSTADRILFVIGTCVMTTLRLPLGVRRSC